jgi:hypothetical protein
MSEQERLIAACAADHNGVFTTAWWSECGLAGSKLANWLERGRIIRLGPECYAFAGTPPTYERRLTAAALSCPQPAAIARVSAAHLWGMVDFAGREPWNVEVVSRRWRRGRGDFVVHESTDLIDDDITVLRGVPVTKPARTLVDLGGTAKGLVGPALDNAIRLKLTSLPEVLSLVQRVARRGRDGVGVIRPYLEEQMVLDQQTDSYLETLFAIGLRQRGLPPPEQQVPILRGDCSVICRLDFAYPDLRLGIALDGMRTHTEQRRFRLDRSQQNEAELAGWMILRYTWWDVTGAMNRTADQIRRALAHRSPEIASHTPNYRAV